MDAIKVCLFSLRRCFSFFDNLKINCLRFSIRNVFLKIFFFLIYQDLYLVKVVDNKKQSYKKKKIFNRYVENTENLKSKLEIDPKTIDPSNRAIPSDSNTRDYILPRRRYATLSRIVNLVRFVVLRKRIAKNSEGRQLFKG